MHDVDVPPFAGEVFRHQPAVAVVGLVLAAQKAAAVERFLRHLLDAPLLHQGQEPPLVVGPSALLLLVEIEDVLGGSQRRPMLAAHATDGLGEIGEIVALGEAGQLRDVIQAHVDDLPDADLFQPLEKNAQPRIW